MPQQTVLLCAFEYHAIFQEEFNFFICINDICIFNLRFNNPEIGSNTGGFTEKVFSP